MLKRMRYTCALVALVTSAWGQSFQGSVRGNVADPTGAAVAQSKITLADDSTGISRSTVTSAAAEYSLAQ
jgi:trimeric autotransporter adhesin